LGQPGLGTDSTRHSRPPQGAPTVPGDPLNTKPGPPRYPSLLVPRPYDSHGGRHSLGFGKEKQKRLKLKNAYQGKKGLNANLDSETEKGY
jgi:hypothetical protein